MSAENREKPSTYENSDNRLTEMVNGARRRDWQSRAMSTTFIIAIAIAVPMLCFGIIFSSLDWPARIGFEIGLCVGACLVYWFLPNVTVYVPQFQGIVTLDTLNGGKLIPYGPGLHARFFWESVHNNSHVSLKDVTIVEEETVASGKGGPQLLTRYQYRWRPRLVEIDVYFGIGESTIKQAFTGILSGFFSQLIANVDGNKARKGMAVMSHFAKTVLFEIDDEDSTGFVGIEKEFYDILQAAMPASHKERVKKKAKGKEHEYGINMLSVEIVDMDFPDDVQQARNARAINEETIRVAMRMAGLLNADGDNMIEAEKAFAKLSARERQGFLDRALKQVGKEIAIERIAYEGIPDNVEFLSLGGGGGMGVAMPQNRKKR